MTKIYVYCKKENVSENGEMPVYLLFKNGKGRFFVNTGIICRVSKCMEVTELCAP